MGSFSVSAPPCHFHTYPYNSNFSRQAVHCTVEPQLINEYHVARAISLKSSVLNQSIRACASQKCSNHIHGVNSSNFIRIPSSHEKIANFLAEMAVKLVIGSFIFTASLNVRPAVAFPAKTSVNIEEKREAANNRLDDEEMYMKLLEQEPRNVDALMVILNGKMRRGKIKDAFKYVERLIDIEPDEVEWRLLQALCYEMTGKLSTAKRLFKEILKERPLLLRALHGELDKGLKMFQNLIDENPRDFRPYLCQGIIYSLQDKKKEAEAQFEIYQSLVPEEFPQRGFLDDVVLAAKTESRQQLEKEFKAAYSYRK
ncbi:hypothetical protein Ancab_026749 [Ancistrocladus abbreviatus]